MVNAISPSMVFSLPQQDEVPDAGSDAGPNHGLPGDAISAPDGEDELPGVLCEDEVDSALARYLEGIRKEARLSRSVSATLASARARAQSDALAIGEKRIKKLRDSADTRCILSCVAAGVDAAGAIAGAASGGGGGGGSSRAASTVSGVCNSASGVIEGIAPVVDEDAEKAEELALDRERSLNRIDLEKSREQASAQHGQSVATAARQVTEFMDRVDRAREAAAMAALDRR